MVTWSQNLKSDLIWKGSLFGGVKVAKNEDSDKYVRNGSSIWFDSHSEFLLPDGGIGVSLFGVDSSSKVS